MNGQSDDELNRLRRMVSELSSLNEILGSVAATMSVEEVTSIIIDKTLGHVDAAQGAVFLISSGNKPEDFLTTFVRRKGSGKNDLPLHFNANLAQWMMRNKELLLLHADDDETPLRHIDLRNFGIESLLAAPLLARNEVIGVLVVFNKAGQRAFSDDDGRFVSILSSQCSHVIEAARLYEEEQRLAKIRKELDVAFTIQQSFLPGRGEKFDSKRICGFSDPARSVGGDFFDIIPLDDARVYVSVGDVSGKGIPAALLMANAMAIQRSSIAPDKPVSLVELAGAINRLLCQYNQPEQYITGVMGIIDFASRTFTYVNAGHQPPVVVEAERCYDGSDDGDVPLGLMRDWQYKEITVRLPGDSLLCIYSDGVPDAGRESHAAYTDERLNELLVKTHGKSAADVCETVRQDVKRHQEPAEQFDDVTVLVLRMA